MDVLEAIILSSMYVANIFRYSMACLLIQLMATSDCLSNFPFVTDALCVLFKKSGPTPKSGRYSPRFFHLEMLLFFLSYLELQSALKRFLFNM